MRKQKLILCSYTMVIIWQMTVFSQKFYIKKEILKIFKKSCQKNIDEYGFRGIIILYTKI